MAGGVDMGVFAAICAWHTIQPWVCTCATPGRSKAQLNDRRCCGQGGLLTQPPSNLEPASCPAETNLRPPVQQLYCCTGCTHKSRTAVPQPPTWELPWPCRLGAPHTSPYTQGGFPPPSLLPKHRGNNSTVADLLPHWASVASLLPHWTQP